MRIHGRGDSQLESGRLILKIYFFPGMGADHTLGLYHHLEGIETAWLKWPKEIRPDWEQFLDDLEKENVIDEDSFFAGISFGGLVATRMAARKRIKGLILLGSMASSDSISPILKWVGPAALKILPDFAFEITRMPRWLISFVFGIRKQEHLAHFLEMAARHRPAGFRNLACLALSARPISRTEYPVLTIHGAKDRLLPLNRHHVDHVIRDGGHILSMTHAKGVDRMLLDWMRGFDAGAARA